MFRSGHFSVSCNVSRLGYFWKVLETILRTKVAQKSSNFWWIFWKIFLGPFWINLGSFGSQHLVTLHHANPSFEIDKKYFEINNFFVTSEGRGRKNILAFIPRTNLKSASDQTRDGLRLRNVENILKICCLIVHTYLHMW